MEPSAALTRAGGSESSFEGAAPADGGISRRDVLARSALATGGIALVGGGATTVLIRYFLSRSATYDGMGAVPHGGELSALTPNDKFYVVTKNLLDPAPRLSDWALDVGGMVNSPGTYGSLAALQRLPQQERAVTLECISLTVANHLISTAAWRGVLLEDVLKDRGGVKTGANRIVFHSADGYTSSLPLQQVLANKTMLAWHMNGVPLPSRHGFPLRAIVPGYYGEKSAKWLVGIELIDHNFKDFYDGEGWAKHPSKTFSRIDVPAKNRTIHGATTLQGIAFAGVRGIKMVEVSTDCGKTWSKATLKTPLSPQAWVFWTWPWANPAPGHHVLTVRATDGTGVLQTPTFERAPPDGASGYHFVPVRVA
ncbi:MAG: molybdopterin-dependent oxidoreductase [Chloroflexota bacterium]